MALRYNSGPLVDDLLFLSGDHRVDYIIQNPNSLSDGGLLRVRRGCEKLWEYVLSEGIPERVMHHIRLAGFEGVIQCDYRRVDHALISALVERWRPETHTFHMPFGEVTITLQDIQVLWGLPVTGTPVSGVDERMSPFEIKQKFFGLTGIELDDGDIKAQKINMPAILSKLKNSNFPANPTEEQCIQRARTIIVLLIGGTLFPSSSSNFFPVRFLYLLDDLTACGGLSWGSAVLSFLYNQLCKASSPSTNEIGGPVFILMLWAWQRIPALSPTINIPTDWNKPYGSRWQQSALTYRESAAHYLITARSTLNSLTESGFFWTPYDDILHRLPEYCRNGQACWRSDTYLICWDVVEPHLPSRVLRQFGMFQPIPTNTLMTPQLYNKFHKSGRAAAGRCGNWLAEHQEYILAWLNFQDTVVTTDLSSSIIASQEYMQWYLSRSIPVIHDPLGAGQNLTRFPNDGGRVQILGQGLSQVYQASNEEPIRDMAGRYMGYANTEVHMSYQPTYEVNTGPSVLPPLTQQLARNRAPRPRRRNVGGRGNQGGGAVETPENNQHNTPLGSQQFDLQSPNCPGSSLMDYRPVMSSEYGGNVFEYGGSSSNFNLFDENFVTPSQQMGSDQYFEPFSSPAMFNVPETRPPRHHSMEQFSGRRNINVDLNAAYEPEENQEGGEEEGGEDEPDEIPLANRRPIRRNAGIPRRCGT